VNLSVLQRRPLEAARGRRAVTGLLAAVACLAAGMATAASSSRQADEPRVIEVIARRYTFEPAEIDVTEGERVRLLVVSGDGLHGFEIKQFKISKEIPRGKTPVVIEFTANTPGSFPILCSIFCGDGHEAMKGTLVVKARAAQP
jgi:cytochrome c oxidase subunit II